MSAANEEMQATGPATRGRMILRVRTRATTPPCSQAPVARSLIFQVPNGPQGRGYIIQALLIIQDRSRRRFVEFKLVAHLLQARSKNFNLLLLAHRFAVLIKAKSRQAVKRDG